MSEKINWSLNVQIASGPKIGVSGNLEVDAYDVINVVVDARGVAVAAVPAVAAVAAVAAVPAVPAVPAGPAGPAVPAQPAVPAVPAVAAKPAVAAVAAKPVPVEVQIQPGAAGKVQFLLIQSSVYGPALTYKVNNVGNAIVLDQMQLFVGNGAVETLGQPPNSLVFSNAIWDPNKGQGTDVLIQILVGRFATV